MSVKEAPVRIKYYMCDLVCYVINYCAEIFVMGKRIVVYMIKSQFKKKPEKEKRWISIHFYTNFHLKYG